MKMKVIVNIRTGGSPVVSRVRAPGPPDLPERVILRRMLGSGRSYRALRAGMAAFVAVVGLTSQARANGRFPAAGQVVVDPGDKQHIVLRTTYGILQTTDGGKN